MRQPDYPSEDTPKWAAADSYFADLLAPADGALVNALAANGRAGASCRVDDMLLAPKPKHLEAHYGQQFEDTSIAQSYATRPPYPDQVFEVLERLLPTGPRSLLDLGCGTGDITLGMRGRVDRIDAVDPSRAMLEVAATRPRADDVSLTWINDSAEAFVVRAPYSLVVAAESFHWMDWPIVLPKIARALGVNAWLALVRGRNLKGLPWMNELQHLIPRYSTNQDYKPYDIVAELSTRGLFQEAGRVTTTPIAFTQSLSDYVESFHTRNGFSRERMSADAASAFDQALTDLVLAHASDGWVRGWVTAEVVWGTPVSTR